MSAEPRDLSDLRREIDRIDAAIVDLLAERLRVCRDVATLKESSGATVIQPSRVRDVLRTRTEWAIVAGVDPDFAEAIFRTLLAETHRIEVAEAGGTDAPVKTAAVEGSDLDTVACRIDHVVVAVEDLEAAGEFFTGLGFVVSALAADQPGIVVQGVGIARVQGQRPPETVFGLAQVVQAQVDEAAQVVGRLVQWVVDQGLLDLVKRHLGAAFLKVTHRQLDPNARTLARGRLVGFGDGVRADCGTANGGAAAGQGQQHHRQAQTGHAPQDARGVQP